MNNICTIAVRHSNPLDELLLIISAVDVVHLHKQETFEDQRPFRYQGREDQGSWQKALGNLSLRAEICVSDHKQPTTTGFITAAELGQIRKRCIRISTGSKQLDAALNG